MLTTEKQILYRNSTALFDAMDKNSVKSASVSLDFEGDIKDMNLWLQNGDYKQIDRSSKDWDTVNFQPIRPRLRKPGDTTRSVVSEEPWPDVMAYIAKRLHSDSYFPYDGAPFEPRINGTYIFYPEKNVIKEELEVYALHPNEGAKVYYLNKLEENLESL